MMNLNKFFFLKVPRVGHRDHDNQKTTLRQTTQDSGSMGGFSGFTCLSCHMAEMGKKWREKNFLPGGDRGSRGQNFKKWWNLTENMNGATLVFGVWEDRRPETDTTSGWISWLVFDKVR